MAQSLIKSGTKLSLLTLGSRVLGLLREMTKAAFLGTSQLSDAFTVAFFIPNLLRRLFAENSISVAFIPTFRGYLDKESREKTKEFLSATFTFLTFSVSLAVIVGILAAPLIVPLFGTGTPETLFLTRIMFPYLAVISIAALFQGILNGVRIFSPSGFTPILFNLTIIGCTWFFAERMGNPARAMALGVLIGGFIQMGFQIPFVLKQGFRFSLISPLRALRNPGTRKVLRLIGPTIIGMAAYQLNDLVSSILASNAGPGIVSSLQYSLRLQELILGIFAVSIGTVILPDLSALASKKDWTKFNKLLARAMNAIALITIPVTFFFLASGEALITLLFKTKSFSDESVALTLAAFTWHIPGLYFIAANRILAPAFYARSDTRSPTFAGILSFVANILMALLLVGPMSGGGIALALSIASAVNTVLLVVFLGRTGTLEMGPLVRNTIIYAGKLIVFSVIASIPIRILNGPLYAFFANGNRLISQGIPLMINLVVFSTIGLVLLFITGDPLLNQAVNALRNRSKND